MQQSGSNQILEEHTEHPTSAAVLPWVHKYNIYIYILYIHICNMQLSPGNLQLCFVGFSWHTGSLRAAADALNQHMEKVSSLILRLYFSNRFLSYIHQKNLHPGDFFPKTVSMYFSYMHRRNTLNQPAHLSGCYCNELSFFSHSCLPMDFFCFLQGI